MTNTWRGKSRGFSNYRQNMGNLANIKELNTKYLQMGEAMRKMLIHVTEPRPGADRESIV